MAMKLQRMPSKTPLTAIKKMFHSVPSEPPKSPQPQGVCNVRVGGEELMSKFLDRRWMLKGPDTEIHQVVLSATEGKHGDRLLGNTSFTINAQPCLGDDMTQDDKDKSFYVVRDDLLHPLVNGNKARKLDALLPLLEDHSITDVVTCGGCQSAHATAVAVSCAERGLKSHLLLRGEQPEILTGYNLVSTMYGNVTHVPRSIYAGRQEMLKSHADLVAGNDGYVVWCNEMFEASFASSSVQMSGAENYQRKVVIINEGAGDAVALLGVFRLVQYLSQDHLLGRRRPVNLIVDAGTGTTAVGLGLAAACLGLPWEITAVMLADTVDGYKRQEKQLIAEFKRLFGFLLTDGRLNELDCSVVHWVKRLQPRKFGNVLEGEIAACQRIAQQTGILVDPVYTLAAWDMATLLSDKKSTGDARVVMVHTGGTLGMFGLAQRYKSSFGALKDDDGLSHRKYTS